MRTLKKTLCLVLCLAMMAGLCVFASADFEDQDKIENEEAVAVLSGIGVINGDDQGNFNPKGTLTRAEATVIITKLLGAADIKATTDAFTDVAENYWGMPYIAYCVAEGVVAGMGDGTFAPNAKLTGYQWATLLLRAIGYEIAGETWQIDVAKLVKSLSLAKGMTFVGTEEISREDACQMALNALYAQTVHYEGGSKVTVGGVEIVTDSTLVKETYIDGTDVKAETLAHTYFPGLEKKTTTEVTPDKFGREGAIAYEYTAPGAKTAEVIYKAYVEPDYSFVAEEDIAFADLADGINDALEITDVDEQLDTASATMKTNKDVSNDEIKAGDKVEIYVNADDKTEVETIIVVRYTIEEAEVASKAVASGANKGKYAVTLGTGTVYAAKDEYTDGAYYLVAQDDSDNVLDTQEAETFVGTMTRYTNKGVYTVSGETYTSAIGSLSSNMGKEMLYVLNNAGQIGLVTDAPGAPAETITDYVIVKDANVKSEGAAWPSTARTLTAQVQVLQSNGELAVYDLPLTQATKAVGSTVAAGDWYFKIGSTAVKVESTSDVTSALDGVYTYKVNDDAITFAGEVADFTGSETASTVAVAAVDSGNNVTKTSITKTIESATVIFNDKTVFILKTSDNKLVVKTGLAALEDTTVTAYKAIVDVTKPATGSNVNVAKVVFAEDVTFVPANGTSTNKDLIYVDGNCTITADEDGNPVYTYTAYKNDGTTIEVTYTDDSVTAGIYEYNSKNVIGTEKTTGTDKVNLVSGTTYQIGTEYVTVNSSSTVVKVNGELEKGATVAYVAEDGVVTVLFVTKAAE